MTDKAIIEAAAQALREADIWVPPRTSEVVLAAVTPLIESAILEEAAKVAMDHPEGSYQVAVAIRAMKQQPLEEIAKRLRERPESPEITK
jgi:hypothetical protein